MSSKLEDVSLTIYLTKLDEVPLLKKKDEKKLAKRIEMGNQEARRRFILANLKLVVSIAKRFNRLDCRHTLSELIQYGNVGLIKAVDSFNWRLGFKFSTYAESSIERAILRELTKKLPRTTLDETPIEDDTESSSYETLEKISMVNLVRDAIADLPERERQIIVMRYFESRRIKDIAKDLKISEPRIRQLKARAIRRLGKSKKLLNLK